MSGLVVFDQKGAFGPAMTLIYNSQYYNAKGVLDLANLLKANFLKLANIKAKGKKEFCAFVQEKNKTESPVTAAEVISTRFFQNMKKSEPSPLYHEKVLGFIVPRMLKTVQEQIPHVTVDTLQVNEWAARFIESYMTEEQIKNHCETHGPVPEKIMDERKSVGMELYNLATTKQVTEKDLDLLIDVSQVALERLKKADHFTTTLSLTGRYLALFSMNEENPTALGEDVLGLLSTVFRKKMFPKKD